MVRRALANRFVLAVLALAVAAALFGLAGLRAHPVAFAAGSRLAQPAKAAVEVGTRACPAPGSAGLGKAGIAVATDPAAAGTGRAVVTRLSPAGSTAAAKPLHAFAHPGQLELLPVREAPPLPRKARLKHSRTSKSVPTGPARGGVMIQAAGGMAQGLEVEQTGAGGLATGRCEAPGTDFWFVGPGVSSAADIQLYLMNVDSQPADASVSVLAEGTSLLPGADTGITVPPHGMVIQSLDKLLHGSKVVALHVSASAGRLVAAVRESKSAAKPGGWLPAASAPAKRLVLPGLPGTPGTRELYVAVPGGNDAQVKLTAVTGKGSYQPTGGNGINLPGGAAVGIALSSLGGISGAISVSASVPVTAVMLVPGGAPGAPGAFTVGSGPVLQQGVVADLPGSAAGTSEFVLAAPRHAATVRISVATAKSGIAARTVRIAAGRSTVVKIHPPRGSKRTDSITAVITPLPGSGPVYAGRVISVHGTVRTILPVLSSPTSVSLPAVQEAGLSTVLP